MGGCLAKLFGGRNTSLTEMVSATHKHFDNDAADEEAGDSSAVAEQNIQISKVMSSSGIIIQGATVKGEGLVLADTSVEQDSAYWEWSIDDVAEDSSEGLVKFGVCTKKNAEFYKAMAENEKNDEINRGDNMTILMKAMPTLKKGDVVGIAVQHSDMPMIQFLHNGEQKYELSINKFRGTVFPALYMEPQPACIATLVFKDGDLKQVPPSTRFQPLMAERSIV